MSKLRHLKSCSKGGPLMEFALGAVLLIFVILGTFEFTLEVFARHTTERLTTKAAHVYALTRDEDKARDVAFSEADFVTRQCLQPLEIDLFDSVTPSPFDQFGRDPDGVNDSSAVAFRLISRCDWPRITPVGAAVLGPDGDHASSIVMRFK